MGETGTSDSEKAGFVGLELANWSEKKKTQVKWALISSSLPREQ